MHTRRSVLHRRKGQDRSRAVPTSAVAQFVCGEGISYDQVITNRQRKVDLNPSGPVEDPANPVVQLPTARSISLGSLVNMGHMRDLGKFYYGRLVFFYNMFYRPDSASSLSQQIKEVVAILRGSDDAAIARIFDQLRDYSAGAPVATARRETVEPSPAALPIEIRGDDVLSVAAELTRQGKRVFVQDAANAFRPLGGAMYKKGTLEERIAQYTSLFEATLARICLKDGDLEHGIVPSDFDSGSKAREVFRTKANLLAFIYETLANGLDEPLQAPWVSYEQYEEYKRSFFARRYLTQIQNLAYELPPGGGHVEYCHFFIPYKDRVDNPWDVWRTSKGIDVLRKTKISEIEICQVAAVDFRGCDRDRQRHSAPVLPKGVLDYACSTNPRYQALAADMQALGSSSLVAHRYNQSSINFTLQAAAKSSANVILLNLLGCGAFKNDPDVIADQFAQAIADNMHLLVGKSIIFVGIRQNEDKFRAIKSALVRRGVEEGRAVVVEHAAPVEPVMPRAVPIHRGFWAELWFKFLNFLTCGWYGRKFGSRDELPRTLPAISVLPATPAVHPDSTSAIAPTGGRHCGFSGCTQDQTSTFGARPSPSSP